MITRNCIYKGWLLTFNPVDKWFASKGKKDLFATTRARIKQKVDKVENDGIEFYILPVFGCVQPEPLIGPFKTYAEMQKRAQMVAARQGDMDAIFWLRTAPNPVGPMVGSFSGKDLTSPK